MRKKYHTLEEYREANALRQREWRRKRRIKLGLKLGKRGRKPKHATKPTTKPKPKTRSPKGGLELAIH